MNPDMGKSAVPNDQQTGAILLSLVRQTALQALAGNSRDASKPSALHKVGRNEACPCGSGLKYKRCCMARNRQGDLAASPETVMELSPDMLPKIQDENAFYEDFAHFDHLLESDPQLSSLCLDPFVILEFGLSLQTSATPDLKEAAAMRQLFGRFLRKHGQAIRPQQLLTGMLDLAHRRRHQPADFRALVLAATFLHFVEDVQHSHDNPVLYTLFVASLRRAQPLFETLERVEEMKAQIRQRLLIALASDGPVAPPGHRGPAGIWPQPPADVDDRLAWLERQHDWICDVFRERGFAVSLPRATLLPLLLLLNESAEKTSHLESKRIRMHQIRLTGLHADEQRWFSQEIEKWQAIDTGTDPIMSAAVGFVRWLLDHDAIRWILVELQVALLAKSNIYVFDGEPEVLRGVADIRVELDALEIDGDFLLASGYPQMAGRIWGLRAERAPVPLSVMDKLSKIEHLSPILEV